MNMIEPECAKHCERVIEASAPTTELWLGDAGGHFVQRVPFATATAVRVDPA
jgi:hypothetical protein